jgi:hypothetical protein
MHRLNLTAKSSLIDESLRTFILVLDFPILHKILFTRHKQAGKKKQFTDTER